MRSGRCGNDPRTTLTPGDRSAVAQFEAYLAAAYKPASERTAEEATLVAEMQTPPTEGTE